MADNPTPAVSESDDDENPSGEPDGTKTKDDADSEKLELRRRRDSANAKLRQTEKTLAETLAKLEALEHKAAEGDDKKALELARNKVQAAEAERDKWRKTAEKEALESRIKTAAITELAEDSIDDFWTLTRSDFDLKIEDDGEFEIVVKSDPLMTVNDYIKDFAKRKPRFAKNPRSPGKGEPIPGDGKAKSGITMAQLNAMTSVEQQKVLAADPELRKKVLDGFKFS